MGERTLTWLRLTPTCDEAWAWMPAFVRRVTAFCATQPTDIDATWAERTVIAHFAANTQDAMGWLVFADGTPIGHWLSLIEQRGTTKVAYNLQMEMSEALPLAVGRQILDDMADWARERGASVIEGVTWLGVKDDTPMAVTARLCRMFGFVPYRMVIRKPL